MLKSKTIFYILASNPIGTVPRSSSLGPIDFVTQLTKNLQFVDQRAPAYAKRFCSFGPIEIIFAQRLGHGLLFDFLQTLSIGRLSSGRLFRDASHARRQVFGEDQV